MQPTPGGGDAVELLADVRDDLLGGVRRRGGAEVGDEVEQRGVLLVPDGADERGAAAGDRADESLVGERQQVLDEPPPRATTMTSTSRVGVELAAPPRRPPAPRSAPCTGDIARSRTGPPASAAARSRRRPARPPRPARRPARRRRQERQRPLAVGGEQPLGRQHRLSCSRRASSSPTPTGRMSSAASDSVPAARVELRLGVHHDVRARRATTSATASNSARWQVTVSDMSATGSRSVRKTVGARAPRELGDLALDPDRAEPVDPLGDQRRHPATGSGLLGGVEATPSRPRPRALACCHGSAARACPAMRAAYDGAHDRSTDRPTRVLLAAPRGYCAGVDRAVIAVEKALEHYGAPVYVRKQIVHNKHVVETLRGRGRDLRRGDRGGARGRAS